MIAQQTGRNVDFVSRNTVYMYIIRNHEHSIDKNWTIVSFTCVCQQKMEAMPVEHSAIRLPYNIP